MVVWGYLKGIHMTVGRVGRGIKQIKIRMGNFYEEPLPRNVYRCESTRAGCTSILVALTSSKVLVLNPIYIDEEKSFEIIIYTTCQKFNAEKLLFLNVLFFFRTFLLQRNIPPNWEHYIIK